MQRFLISAALVSMLAVTALACFAQDAPPAPKPAQEAPKVDAPPATETEGEEYVEMSNEQAASIDNVVIGTKDLFKELTDSPVRRRQMLYVMIRKRLLEEESRAQNMTVQKDELDKEFARRIEMVGGPDKYRDLVDKGQVDPALELEEIRMNLLLQKLCEKDPETTPTDDQLQEAFRRAYGEKVRLQVIRVLSINEAINIYELLTKGGDFGILAGRNSEHQSRANGGYMPEVPVADLAGQAAEMKKQVDALKENQFSQPFAMNDAQWIVKLLERKPADTTVKIEDKRDELAQAVKRGNVQVLSQQYIQKLVKKYKVKINKDLVKAELPESLKTPEKPTEPEPAKEPEVPKAPDAPK